ncbi:MAG TPA: tyrosine-type recombinase/integrase [Verrucomicrobiae bacterium]|nr:tyrosine-type recombinase/integrase [Verrucomicrobiae bacterium]
MRRGWARTWCSPPCGTRNISRLVSAGVDIRTVQELPGHKTIAMTMCYAHLAPANKRRAVSLLDAEVTANVTTVDFRQTAEQAVRSL